MNTEGDSLTLFEIYSSSFGQNLLVFVLGRNKLRTTITTFIGKFHLFGLRSCRYCKFQN
jgi:uncharacterized membrane protein